MSPEQHPQALAARPRRSRRRIAAILLATVVPAIAMLSPAARAAEESISAFSVWQGSGPLLQTGEKQATFIGVFAGDVYVETERGPLATGSMACSAVVEIDLASGGQNGTAHCAFRADDESAIYAALTCSGIHMVGCDGDFVITGGTGRFAGISGGGPSTIRGNFHEFKVQAGQPVQEAVTGIIYWPELRYTLP